MDKGFNCGKIGHFKLECMKERANKSRETGGESDNKDFGLVFYDASDDLGQHNKKFKFEKTSEFILDVGQLCTIDGHQYQTFNKNSWIGETGASCFIIYNNSNMYNVTKTNE